MLGMQVVHSRTFGNAAPDGSVGVHMLIPLVDLLNHGGDEIAMHDFGQYAVTSNVRWALHSMHCCLLLAVICPSYD